MIDKKINKVLQKHIFLSRINDYYLVPGILHAKGKNLSVRVDGCNWLPTTQGFGESFGSRL